MKFFQLSLVFIILFSGCVGIKYQDQPQSANILNLNKSKAQTRVLATAEQWRNSGVIVEKGKTYAINAKGKWKAGVGRAWTGPDGVGAQFPGDHLTVIAKGTNLSALIGKINENGIPFGIGNHLVLSPQETGTLYYRINDPNGMCGDNEGFVDVEIALSDADKDRLLSAELREFEEGVARKYRESEPKPTLPEEARKFMVQANFAFEQKKYADATNLYAKALNISPWWPEGHFNRALILATSELSNYREAVREMKKYLMLVPNAPNARAAQDKIYQWEGVIK